MADEVLIDGLAWRQLTDTAGAGLSWNEVASVCPLDETPCHGSVNGVDFTGWTWASSDRVYRMVNTLTGFEVPASASFDSPFEVFFDSLAPVLEDSTVQLSFGLSSLAEAPADDMVDVLKLRDARVSVGSDLAAPQAIAVTDTEASSFFGPQPLGVFLVRDPDVELCDNGIDDDGDGSIDIADGDCKAANPVINGLEWRQVIATAGLDVWDMADICPADGTPCTGSIGAIELTGWTWASSSEVVDLIETLTGYRLSGSTIFLPGDSVEIPRIFAKFAPTYATDAHRLLQGYTYDSVAEGEYQSLYPGGNTVTDPLTCKDGVDNNANGKIDFDDAVCLGVDFISIADVYDASANDIMTDSTAGSSRPNTGHFMHRTPVIVTTEVCDNTLDDDGDGLVDGQDVDDCGNGDVDVLTVSCIHDPIFAATVGGQFTIDAQTLDALGQAFAADSIEIWVDTDENSPELVVNDTSEATLRFTPAGHFSYRCDATLGDESFSTGWRRVTVGPFDSPWPAVPVLVSGAVGDKIDVVFLADEDEYSGWNDPAFIQDVGLLIRGGYFTVPWYARNQSYFNFWVGKDLGNTGPDPDDTDTSDGTYCLREAPDDYDRDYAFANVGALVHRSNCRDNAGNGLFTMEINTRRLQVVAHESGHRPFGLSDEYCCDGGYRARAQGDPPYHNLFANEADCRDAAVDREQDPDACRDLIDVDTDEDWWLFEPVYRDTDPEPGDLMQQTGCDSIDFRSACRRIAPNVTGFVDDPNGAVACASPLDNYLGDPDGIADSGDETYWVCISAGTASTAVWQSLINPEFDRYDPGRSESARFKWYLNECDAGRC